MRYLFGFMCVCALGLMPLVGCSETSGTGGSGGTALCEGDDDCDDGNECTDDTCSAGVCEFVAVPDRTGPDEPGGLPGEGTTCGSYAGTCEGGSCAGTFACTEAGIREAIAAGAGPHTFDCNGQTTVTTNAEIGIDNNVILDGEGNLTVEGNLDGLDRGVFSVPDGVTAELRGFTVTGGSETGGMAPPMAGILNEGTLTVTNTTVTENGDFGIINSLGATMTLAGCTISDNPRGIGNWQSTLALTDSTMSNNEDFAISHDGGEVLITNSTVSFGEGSSGVHSTRGSSAMTVINSTFRANGVLAGPAISVEDDSPPVKIAATVVDGACAGDITSNGYNIESPGDTCGFDPDGTDQVNVSSDDLNLGPLQDNGGPSETHALGAGSVAIDVIPADMCEVDEDQRGIERPQGGACDVGAVEMEVAP